MTSRPDTVEQCGFSRGCFECENEATHEIEAGTFDDERSGLPACYAPSVDGKLKRGVVCPCHARSWSRQTGRRATRIERR